MKEMFSLLRKIFEKKKYDCESLYGVCPKTMMITAMRIAPPNTRLEVSSENAMDFHSRYKSLAEGESWIFGRSGISLRIDEGFIINLENDLNSKSVNIPDSYCLVHDTGVLLAIISREEVVDYATEFERRLSMALRDKKEL